MKLSVNRFRTRRPDPVEPARAPPPAAPVAVAAKAVPPPASRAPNITDDAFFPSDADDGFGDESFLPPPGQKPLPEDGSAPLDMDAIRREGLTGSRCH